MEYVEFKGKTKNDAITEACTHFSIPSSKLDFIVIDEGKAGFLGIGASPAVIKARVKEESDDIKVTEPVKEIKKEAPVSVNNSVNSAGNDLSIKENVKNTDDNSNLKESVKNIDNTDNTDIQEVAKKFLYDVFTAMKINVQVETNYDESLNTLDVELSGDEMGVLIGKRGQTLDSLQYLVSLVINKGTGEYIRVKVDTENYRQRRKETLENLAKNISYKVKRTRRAVSLEPMNPYERRIIHSALQNDRYVTTHSEGEEPFRRVVVTPKRDSKDYGYKGNRSYNRYNRERGNKAENKESSDNEE